MKINTNDNKNTKIFRSNILKYFPEDLLVELYRLSETFDIDTNRKCREIISLLDDFKVPYAKLGPGTNRYAVLVDEYAMKIALDRIGRIDNMREFRYCKRLLPHVTKAYEISGEGLITSNEYVMVLSMDDFIRLEPEIRNILSIIGDVFFIADVGIDTKNYANFGLRNGSVVVILDYAYVYELAFNKFQCTCGGTLHYNRDFTKLICPLCNKVYSYMDIKSRISKEDEMKEIGDLTELGYKLTSVMEEHLIDPSKTDILLSNKKKKKEKIKSNNFGNFNNKLSPKEQDDLIEQLHKSFKK